MVEKGRHEVSFRLRFQGMSDHSVEDTGKKKHMEDYHEAPRGIFSLLLAPAYTMTFARTSAIAVLGDA